MFIDIIAGARPNFMKIAPIIDAITKTKQQGHNIHYRLVHTGQHYDSKMSGIFFRQLGIPKPDINLGVGSGTQAQQTASIMVEYEKLLFTKSCDACLVVGDVTSTMATAITAKKLGIKVIHVEAGIRSGDISMPEEINRILTDSITDYFFTTTEMASQNLLQTGIKKEQIFFVGNTMIDTLLKQMPSFRKPNFWNTLRLSERQYILITLHRPNNVDDGQNFKVLLEAIVKATHKLPLIFPVHPRTLKTLQQINVQAPQLHFVEPLDYLEFNYLAKNAKAVVTDSGGITEETTVMGVPCMTLRATTERPETCMIGTNELLGTNPDAIQPAMDRLLNNQWKKGKIPERWDGKAAERIIAHLINIM